MRSLWSVSYVGAHTATTIKKLERLLGIKALDVERERYVWSGERLERSTFLVDHAALDWQAVVTSLLHSTSAFASSWQTHGDAMRSLSATVGIETIDSQFKSGVPAGLRQVCWELRADQQYPRTPFSAGPAVVRW